MACPFPATNVVFSNKPVVESFRFSIYGKRAVQAQAFDLYKTVSPILLCHIQTRGYTLCPEARSEKFRKIDGGHHWRSQNSRMSPLDSPIYEFGGFRFDARQGLLFKRNGQLVSLTPKSIELLRAFMESGGCVLTKEELLKRIWKGIFIEEGTLHRHVSFLRQSLKSEENGSQYIETIPKRGYRFVASVRVIEASDEKRAPVPEKTRVQREYALAVLPFINATSDPQAEYLTDGITESIINNLSQLPQLLVLASSTVFRYKGREIDAQEIGRALNADSLLRGKVIQLGEKLIIRAELIKITDGSQIWGAQFDRPSSDILAVQEEIAHEISERLRLRLTSDDKRRLSRRYTQNTEAYGLYLKGRYFWNKFIAEDLQKAIRYFQRAADLDPSYALAYAGIADCYIQLGLSDHGEDLPQNYFLKAKAAARSALEIDAELAEAYPPLAIAMMSHDYDWQGAERAFKRAIELNPNLSTAHQWHFFLLAWTARAEAGLAEAKRALEIEPFSLFVNMTVAFAYYVAGYYEEAQEQCLRTLEIEPRFAPPYCALATHWILENRYGEAIDCAQKAVALAPASVFALTTLGHALAVAGRYCEAREILDDLHRFSAQRYISSYFIAFIYTGLGEHDRAFSCLERAYQERDFWAPWLMEPRFTPLRSDSRFTNLAERLGLTLEKISEIESLI